MMIKPKIMPKEYLDKEHNHQRGKHIWVVYCEDGINDRYSRKVGYLCWWIAHRQYNNIIYLALCFI
jgi:hypothetical protein